MRFRVTVFGILLAFVATGVPQDEPPRESDAYLTLGVRQATEGDFEAALFSLDTATRRLALRPDASAELAKAYLWLGGAYVGVEHPSAAKGKFRRALTLDPQIRPSAGEFPEKVLKVFDEVRLERTASKRGKQAKIAILGGALVGASAIGVAATKGGHAPPNRPPIPAIQISPGGQMIVHVTEVTLTASAADPDGDTMSYTWTLGDGTTATGVMVRHVYRLEGTFAVSLEVRDPSGASATVAADVVVRSLTGIWTDGGGAPDNCEFRCQQSGRLIECPWTAGARSADRFSWRGEILSPRQMTLEYCYDWWGCKPQVGYLTSDLNEINSVGSLGDSRRTLHRMGP